MIGLSAGIPDADLRGTPASVKALINAQHHGIELSRAQFTYLVTELVNLRERIGRCSRNSSKPPSSDGLVFKPPERRKGSGRKRGNSQAIPERGRSCCRSSGWMRWLSTTTMLADAAAPC